ncbi:hypothetical protein SAMD00019534_036980, partial [Acytostelium subglobosum LB1]|uniref:hypothetical protein n=1 Tax=Acytostelium subglobosum LB1 TaxID=1410327 RepID=UPI000644B19C
MSTEFNDSKKQPFIRSWSRMSPDDQRDAVVLNEQYQTIKQDKPKIDFFVVAQELLTFEFERMEKLIKLISVPRFYNNTVGAIKVLRGVLCCTKSFCQQYIKFKDIYCRDVGDIDIVAFAWELEAIQATMCLLYDDISGHVNNLVLEVDRTKVNLADKVDKMKKQEHSGAASLVGGVVTMLGGLALSSLTGGTSVRFAVPTTIGAIFSGTTNLVESALEQRDIKMLYDGLEESIEQSFMYKERLTKFKYDIGLKEQFMCALSSVEQNGYRCCICFGGLVDPHFTMDGQTATYYCYDCLYGWLEMNKTNPRTRQPMTMEDVYKCKPNLVEKIKQYKVIKKNMKVSDCWNGNDLEKGWALQP